MQNKFQTPPLGPSRIVSPIDSSYFVDDHSAVRVDVTLEGTPGAPPRAAFEAAGPRRKIFFEPARTRIAIVTCGGLCPGLNDVIRAITMVCWYRYGVRSVLGIRYGYAGMTAAGEEPLVLTPEDVADIHQDGGTILGSSRGPQDVGKMVDFLVEREINVLFTIGGDGTQRGALAIVREVERRGVELAVVGVPKTIDNDISYTQRTFGFETAVAMSHAPIVAAHMEAQGARNCVGLVKLMGRESGFVAAYATLASSDVNLVLVPEVPFSMPAVMDFLEERLRRKAHAVIVTAEGAGQDLVSAEGTDESGNRVLGDVGPFLKQAIKERLGGGELSAGVKYIDPSYTIRSAPAEPGDSVFCFLLGGNAAHAAMAGRTGVVMSIWNGRFVHVPIELAVSSRKRIDPAGALWQSVLDNTGQPADLT